jgi:transcriptional regulator with GAF, ATPase, and Fis domain
VSGPQTIHLQCAPDVESMGRVVESSLAELGVVRSMPPELEGAVVAVVGTADAAGVAWIRACRSWTRSCVLALIVGEGAVETSLRDGALLLEAGADEVVSMADDGWTDVVGRCVERWSEIEDAIERSESARGMVGRSPAWKRAMRDVAEAAVFGRSPILIMGETGTGKDLLARMAHELDPRAPKGPLVVVDGATLSRDLAGSELFGHERGAFTGAASSREGAIAQSHDGTLFLDEIGELPLDLQSRLLRVLQEGVFKRLGSDLWQRSSFRLVSATNRDLRAEVRAGRFREDLYHRVASVVCRAPALRDRAEDVPALADHFLMEALGRASPPSMASGVRQFLAAREYPGNVRELRQLAHALARRCAGGGTITLGMIPHDERSAWIVRPDAAGWRTGEALQRLVQDALVQDSTLREITRVVEEAAIQTAIRIHGTRRAAAGKLGLTERALQLRRAAERRAGGQSGG